MGSGDRNLMNFRILASPRFSVRTQGTYESQIQACSSCLVSAGFGVEASSIGSALNICTVPPSNNTQNGTTSTSVSVALVPSPTQTQGPIVVSPTVSVGIQVRRGAIPSLSVLVQIFAWCWWLCV